MNLLEHYIVKVYSVEDVTEKFIKKFGYYPKEQMLRATMQINCYGHKENKTKIFCKSDWDKAQKQGYYIA